MEALLYFLWAVGGYFILIPGGIIMGMTVSLFIPAKERRVYRLLPVLFFSLVIGMPSWIGDENPLFMLPFFIALYMLCYSGPWYARLIVGGIFYSLLMPMNMMLDSASFKALHPASFILIGIKTALWGFLLMLARYFAGKERGLMRSAKLWALTGGLTLAPLFATLSFTLWNWNTLFFTETAYKSIILRLGYTILPFAALSSVALLAALIVLSRHEELEEQQKLAEIQAVYYRGLTREQGQVRTLRHDLRNHILVAQSLLGQGDTEGARKYLEELSESCTLKVSQPVCDNIIANAVLSSKFAIMEQEQMQADWQISLPKRLSVSDTELCSLLGNALDNAIEAARDAMDKRVVIRVRADKGILMLRVENALGRQPLYENGLFKTTKTTGDGHGMGLNGMRDIVRKYHGSMDTVVSNGRFELVISVPLAR